MRVQEEKCKGAGRNCPNYTNHTQIVAQYIFLLGFTHCTPYFPFYNSFRGGKMGPSTTLWPAKNRSDQAGHHTYMSLNYDPIFISFSGLMD